MIPIIEFQSPDKEFQFEWVALNSEQMDFERWWDTPWRTDMGWMSCCSRSSASNLSRFCWLLSRTLAIHQITSLWRSCFPSPGELFEHGWSSLRPLSLWLCLWWNHGVAALRAGRGSFSAKRRWSWHAPCSVSLSTLPMLLGGVRNGILSWWISPFFWNVVLWCRSQTRIDLNSGRTESCRRGGFWSQFVGRYQMGAEIEIGRERFHFIFTAIVHLSSWSPWCTFAEMNRSFSHLGFVYSTLQLPCRGRNNLFQLE